MRKRKIILASSSPRRKQLLEEAGFVVNVFPSFVEEVWHFKRPSYMTMHNSWLKVKEVAKNFQKEVIIGADTIIFFENKIIGKPKGLKEAFNMLWMLRGKTHFVYTGVCLFDGFQNIKHCFYDRTKIRFKKFSKEDIKKYHKLVNPLDKSGSYAIQQHTDLLLEKIFGSVSNVVGLPMEKLSVELNRMV